MSRTSTRTPSRRAAAAAATASPGLAVGRAAARWSPDGGNCVEVAQEPAAVHIRDAKAPQGHVSVAPDAWAAFLGAFDAC
ncbi:DUF397 domain-containing protein [Streptomyces sp. NPDC059402]|uniref:DUF397 domain-containing protein n=1 Tax=Streptomyces sp. NPDC059402 TaxID=3346822 RepID=UPI0036A5F9F3